MSGKSKSRPRGSHKSKGSRGNNGKTRNFRKMSERARKGWDTRTRKEGFHQILHTLGPLLSETYGTVKAGKDIAIGAVKITVPRTYRKSRLLKKFDKMF